jgi:hypothetical protein
VLTNNFPLSSRWVVFSNLFSPGRCSASGVSSSCPSTAATTWYSSPLARQRQRRPSAHPAAATSTTSSPRGGRATPGFVPPLSSPQEKETGQPWPCRRRHLVGDAGTPAGDMSGAVLAPETTTDVVSPQCANPKRTDDANTLAKGLLGVSLVPEITVRSVPDATSSPSID